VCALSAAACVLRCAQVSLALLLAAACEGAHSSVFLLDEVSVVVQQDSPVVWVGHTAICALPADGRNLA
jgi:hypothetical protein